MIREEICYVFSEWGMLQDSDYYSYYLGTLSCGQISATLLKIRHPEMNFFHHVQSLVYVPLVTHLPLVPHIWSVN